jgi:hypothetical protein
MLRAKRRCSPYEASPIDREAVRERMIRHEERAHMKDSMHDNSNGRVFEPASSRMKPMRIQQEFHMLSNVVVPPTLYPIGRHVCR